jgi:hypothetical protein
MGGSTENVATVFEFNEEEESTEATSQQLLEKFQPKNHDNPLDKYAFLQHCKFLFQKKMEFIKYVLLLHASLVLVRTGST